MCKQVVGYYPPSLIAVMKTCGLFFKAAAASQSPCWPPQEFIRVVTNDAQVQRTSHMSTSSESEVLDDWDSSWDSPHTNLQLFSSSCCRFCSLQTSSVPPVCKRKRRHSNTTTSNVDTKCYYSYYNCLTIENTNQASDRIQVVLKVSDGWLDTQILTKTMS